MQIGTNYYNVKLKNDKGIEVKVNNVYTEKGFFDAGEKALEYVNSVNNENCKLIEITRVLRDATLTECMLKNGKEN
jgi:hypothetical protein